MTFEDTDSSNLGSNSQMPVSDIDKEHFLRWLRLLLFQLMLDIIEVSHICHLPWGLA